MALSVRRWWGFTLALALLGSIGCSKKEQPSETFEAPHPRERPLPSTADRQSFRVAEGSRVEFKSKTRQLEIQGTVGALSGELSVNLMDLRDAQGSILCDLQSLTINAGDAPTQDGKLQALAWLELGDRVKPAQRQRWRHAKFSLTKVLETSSETPHEARITKKGVALELGDARAPGVHNREERQVRLLLEGDLELHGYRVAHRMRLAATFRYPVPATSGARPEAILVESLSPLHVSLKAHDIKPRDAAGRLLAQQQRRIGRDVATNLAVRAFVRLTPLD